VIIIYLNEDKNKISLFSRSVNELVVHTVLFRFLFFVDDLEQKGMRHDFDVRTQAIFRHFRHLF
jgi:hypothetical protein